MQTFVTFSLMIQCCDGVGQICPTLINRGCSVAPIKRPPPQADTSKFRRIRHLRACTNDEFWWTRQILTNLTNFDGWWRILTNFDVQTNFDELGELWRILTHFDKHDKFWQTTTNFDELWRILTNFDKLDKFWQTLVNFDEFWQAWRILANFDKFWGSGEIWEILRNLYITSWTCAHFGHI